jgi:hypothetical protein
MEHFVLSIVGIVKGGLAISTNRTRFLYGSNENFLKNESKQPQKSSGFLVIEKVTPSSSAANPICFWLSEKYPWILLKMFFFTFSQELIQCFFVSSHSSFPAIKCVAELHVSTTFPIYKWLN